MTQEIPTWWTYTLLPWWISLGFLAAMLYFKRVLKCRPKLKKDPGLFLLVMLGSLLAGASWPVILGLLILSAPVFALIELCKCLRNTESCCGVQCFCCEKQGSGSGDEQGNGRTNDTGANQDLERGTDAMVDQPMGAHESMELPTYPEPCQGKV